MTCLLSDLEDKIAELINGIDSGPYNYHWGKSNERDMAKAEFPVANIYLESEDSLDEPDGAWSRAYFSEVTYRIEVMAQLDGEYENPPVEIRKMLYKCLDDLKRLFGKYWNLDGTCNVFMFRGMEIVEQPSGDVFIPSKMITRWLCRYESDRLDPTVVAQ